MDILPVDIASKPPKLLASTLQTCTQANQNKYYYSKVAVISTDKTVADNLKTYFEKYVLVDMGFPSNWTVETYESQDKQFEEYQKYDETPFCFGVTVNKFDTANDDYDIDFHFAKDQLPDTNQPAFNNLIKAPDLMSWS